MIDTTKVIIESKDLGKIAESMQTHGTGLSSGEIALIAAAIGASAAILSQLIMFLMTRYKEKNNLKRELIAEERRISYLITGYCKELISSNVNKNYWFRISQIQKPINPEKSKESYLRHFSGSKAMTEAISKVRISTSEYYKTITHFTNLTGKNPIINEELIKIRDFQARKISLFEDVKALKEMSQAAEDERNEMKKIYSSLSKCFDKIHSEMEKKL